MSEKAVLTDVTLRDGLQMEAYQSTERKAELFRLLLHCGYERLEITSFVHPKWVPQFADAEAFCAEVFGPGHPPFPELMAFVPNAKGLERLLKFPIPWVSLFVAASGEFNRRNVNQSIEETLSEAGAVIERARREGRKSRLYLSTVFGCPYQGAVSHDELNRLFERAAALNPDEIALSDTIGVALPEQVEAVVADFKGHFPLDRTAFHSHDTYGLALAGVEAAWRAGIRRFDGATGGVGGCPYAKGATGNAATEGIAYMLHRQGRRAAFSRDGVAAALNYLHGQMGLQLHSSLHDILQKGGRLHEIQ